LFQTHKRTQDMQKLSTYLTAALNNRMMSV
jgi:hypothetical protein